MYQNIETGLRIRNRHNIFDCIFALGMCNSTILYLVCENILVVLLLMPKSGQVINNYINSISPNLRHTVKNTYVFFIWEKISLSP